MLWGPVRVVNCLPAALRQPPGSGPALGGQSFLLLGIISLVDEGRTLLLASL